MQDNCPLVIIRWQDSAQPLPAWRHLSQLPTTRAIECATVGWLLKDGDGRKGPVPERRRSRHPSQRTSEWDHDDTHSLRHFYRASNGRRLYFFCWLDCCPD